MFYLVLNRNLFLSKFCYIVNNQNFTEAIKDFTKYNFNDYNRIFLIYITIAFLNLDFIEFRSFMILENNSKEIPLKVLENLAHYLY